MHTTRNGHRGKEMMIIIMRRRRKRHTHKKLSDWWKAYQWECGKIMGCEESNWPGIVKVHKLSHR